MPIISSFYNLEKHLDNNLDYLLDCCQANKKAIAPPTKELSDRIHQNQKHMISTINLQTGIVDPSELTNIKIKSAATKTEIDSVSDIFGALYRVWNQTKLLGTFYEKLDGKWVAQPSNREDFRPTFNTPEQAHLTIIASWLQP